MEGIAKKASVKRIEHVVDAIILMDENDSEVPQGPEQPQEEKKEDHRRPFNPMATYFEFGAALIAVYILFFVFGYEVLLIGTLAVLLYVFRETYYILEFYSYGFARKASIFNAIHASVWFILLAINIFTILQNGVPLIFPDVESFTITAPLFVLMAAFGCKNIERMYKPSDEKILASKAKAQ